jgi:putative membrane protein
MGSSFVLIALFLILYVFKVATLGPEQYRGPEPIRLYIYLPALIIHLGLSIASVPLVLYNALTGLVLRGSAGLSHHRKTGRIAYPAWTLSLALGLIVYVMLRLS